MSNPKQCPQCQLWYVPDPAKQNMFYCVNHGSMFCCVNHGSMCCHFSDIEVAAPTTPIKTSDIRQQIISLGRALERNDCLDEAQWKLIDKLTGET